MPFRFLSAYRELKRYFTGGTVFYRDGQRKRPRAQVIPPAGRSLEEHRFLFSALDRAVRESIRNVEGLHVEDAMIACDVSASMQGVFVSAHSTIRAYDMGLLLGFLLQTVSRKTEIGIFGDTFEVLRLPQESILERGEQMLAEINAIEI